eukprot:GAHX01000258.1.p1 GENE.GAHX01000258.1~~GAHX01000258.1.p1  ORF type:complete len:105 (-),score=16.89 GAHX01000258.1:207-521(-)
MTKEIPIGEVFSYIKCSVCLNFIQNATVTVNCMHRFCKPCIEQSLRKGKKECPYCKAFCASKRELKRDAEYQNFVDLFVKDNKLYENLDNDVGNMICRDFNKII